MRYVARLIVCASLAASGAAFAQGQELDGVARKLFSGEKQLQPWADEMEKAQPQTLTEAWTALEVLLRAERDEAALRLLPSVYALHLKSGTVGIEDTEIIRIMILLLSVPQKQGNLCVSFFEVFGAVVSVEYFNWGWDKLRTFMQHSEWSEEKITGWLYERYQAAEAFEPKTERLRWSKTGVYALCPMTDAAQGWQTLYFQQLRASPQGDKAFRQMRDDARQTPSDMRKVTVFLTSLNDTRRVEQEDAGWLLKAFQKSPYGSWVVGNWATNDAQKADIKEAFLKQALGTPLVAKECDRFRADLRWPSSKHEPELTDDLVRAQFGVMVLDELNKLYLHINRADDAQRVMLEARALRKTHSRLPDKGLLAAGLTQGASGARVVEAEIKAREKQDKRKPEYWMDRATYYRGRNELKEEEDALRQALKLDDAAARQISWHAYDNHDVFSSLFYFLWRHERTDEAVALFKARRDAVRHNASGLTELYRSCGWTVWRAKRFAEFESWLAEDMRGAYTWLKTTPKEDSHKYRSAVDANVYLFFWPEVAIRLGVLDFQNDPFAWEVLAMTPEDSGPFGNYVKILLYSKDGNIPSPNDLYPKGDKKISPDENMLQKLKDLADREMLRFYKFESINGLLVSAGDYENANGFLRVALKQEKDEHRKSMIYEKLIYNCLELGDWQNCEKYINLSAEQKGNYILRTDILRRTADLAEKAGAAEAAQRMRERIKNLGAGN